MSDIFISYASEDRPKAKQLAEALEHQGWFVWWDIAIPAGKKFGEVIAEKLSQADVIVVLWSAISVKKDWVLDEAKVGKQRNILIPVSIEQVNPPLGFGQIHTANLAEWEGTSEASEFIRLVQDISEIIGQPPVLQGSVNVNSERSETDVNDPERTVRETPPVATDAPFEIKTSQLIRLKRYVFFSKNRRNIVLPFLTIVVLVVGGILIANWSNRSTENSMQEVANLDPFGYCAEGLKYYEVGLYADAYPLLLKAADQGNAKAILYVGYMYRDGQATPVLKDNNNKENKLQTASLRDEEAVRWFRKSAFYDNAEAQYNLGYMYETGRGVQQSDVEAVKWYRKAAKQGNLDAQNKLEGGGD